MNDDELRVGPEVMKRQKYQSGRKESKGRRQEGKKEWKIKRREASFKYSSMMGTGTETREAEVELVSVICSTFVCSLTSPAV